MTRKKRMRVTNRDARVAVKRLRDPRDPVLSGKQLREAIAETEAIKRDPNLMAQIRAARRYFQRGGKGIPLEQVDWGTGPRSKKQRKVN